jgi:hypothetical protein
VRGAWHAGPGIREPVGPAPYPRPSVGAGARVTPGRRAARRRQRRRAVATGITGVTVVAALLATAFAISRDETPKTQVKGEELTRPGASSSVPGETTSTTTTTAPPTTVTSATGGGGAATTGPHRGATTAGAAVGPGSPGSPGSPGVGVVPPVTAVHSLDWSPGFVTDDGTTTWAVDLLESGRVARLDATGRVLASGHVAPYVSGLAAAGDGAWVLRSACPSGGPELVHLDAEARASTPLPVAVPLACDVSPGRSDLAAGGGRLWIAAGDPARPGGGRLLGIEPGSGTIVADVELAGVPQHVQTDGDVVWVTLAGAPSVASGDLVVGGFDVRSAHQVGRVVVHRPLGLPMVRAGAVWFGDATGARRVPSSGGAGQTFPVEGPGCGGGTLFGFVPAAVGATTVWGTRLELHHGAGPGGDVTSATVCRLDLRTGTALGWDAGAFTVTAGDASGAWLVDQTGAGLVRWTIG